MTLILGINSGFCLSRESEVNKHLTSIESDETFTTPHHSHPFQRIKKHFTITVNFCLYIDGQMDGNFESHNTFFKSRRDKKEAILKQVKKHNT